MASKWLILGESIAYESKVCAPYDKLYQCLRPFSIEPIIQGSKVCEPYNIQEEIFGDDLTNIKLTLSTQDVDCIARSKYL